MKPVLLFSDDLPQLLPTVTAAARRLPELEFDFCSDVGQVLRKLRLTNFSAMVIYLGSVDQGYMLLLQRLRSEPVYSNLPVIVYKEIPDIDALTGFLGSI
ncbi:hypothetical protein [Parachryseolinea silvisoli]|uniref:hypothetical protein n=1 Tax=Parachryseolinea silvisoli TaxID=2873601 RepID=UPI002265F5C6|nr:hypothetical protein [Parachryseolinea silvisoli]MCD9015170.1 hypothetical protein [Parachryseolinea silvisoli]